MLEMRLGDTHESFNPRELDEPTQDAPYLGHTLVLLAIANQDFVADRELIRLYNQHDLPTLAKHFLNEVKEFNGGDHMGYFSEPENYADYCQQEVSDIIIFGLQLFDFLSQKRLISPEIDMNQFQADILIKAHAAAQRFDIRQVTAEIPMHRPQNLETEEDLFNYNQVRKNMTDRANLISDQIKDYKGMYRTVVDVLAYGYALQWALGLDPVRAGMEKVMRNILLYQSYKWQLSEDEHTVLTAQKTQPERQDYLQKLYDAWRAEAKAGFVQRDYYQEVPRMIQ